MLRRSWLVNNSKILWTIWNYCEVKMAYISNENKKKYLNKCKTIDCKKQDCDTCIARIECYKLRQLEKHK